MTALFRRHRRLLTAGMLAAFVAAWVLPAQACVAGPSEATAQTHCPDCPCPDGACGTGAAACAASMLPTAAAFAPTLDKAVPAFLPVRPEPLQDLPRASVTLRLDQAPAYSPPSSVNIRFCRFQK